MREDAAETRGSMIALTGYSVLFDFAVSNIRSIGAIAPRR